MFLNKREQIIFIQTANKICQVAGKNVKNQAEAENKILTVIHQNVRSVEIAVKADQCCIQGWEKLLCPQPNTDRYFELEYIFVSFRAITQKIQMDIKAFDS